MKTLKKGTNMSRDKRFCGICGPNPNRTIYWHVDEKTKLPWCYCNKCGRGYSLREYCELAGYDLDDFIRDGIDFDQEMENEIQVQSFPSRFINLSDPRSKKGLDYIFSRGLEPKGDMYYDLDNEGIAFPYYYNNYFAGAQVRFIEERIKEDGSKWKITTLPGTRLGLLVYNWNQTKFMEKVKGVIVTEGAFNSIAIQQALDNTFGGIANNPWRCVAISGSGVSEHHAEVFKELIEQGYKVIVAPDHDDAGFKMYDKFKEMGICTHYAIPPVAHVDWNDMYKDMKNDFSKFFIKECVVKVEQD